MSFFKKTVSLFSVFLFICVSTAAPLRALTISEERELADKFVEAVHDYFDVIDDQPLNDYINSLGKRLTQKVPPQPFALKFRVIRADTFNAFAGPGGNIFIFSGLIEAMENENELAAIMAHEIAHVTARHIPDIIERSKRTSFTSMAGVIAGILVGLGGAPAAGTALSLGSIAAGQTMMLSYSRENELQADYLSIRYLEDAGFHEYGMLSALKKMRSREWFGEQEIPTYLKTHPAVGERMAMLGNSLQNETPELKDSYEFKRTRARVMALYGKRTNSLNRLSRMVHDNPEDPSSLYGYGLAIAEGGNPEKAIPHLEKSVSIKPDDPNIAVALGRVYFLAGDNQKALDTLKGIDNIHQYGPDGLFTVGRVQSSQGDNRSAIITFETLLSHYPNHGQTLFFMGQSQGQEGNFAKAHYYLGRFHKQQGNLGNARFHFDRALSEARDEETREEIQSLIKDVDSAHEKEKRLERQKEEMNRP
jgi:beta-barrel assembly-enhancing protease